MQFPTQKIYLVRHGETSWTLSQQHTGSTDITLTEKGKKEAVQIGKRLSGHPFKAILCSPLKRAQSTCEIAGLMQRASLDADLKEWNYGDYEGLTTAEIWKRSPGWNIFSNGAPGGESPADISKRVHRVLTKVQSFQGDVALFSHGHFLRAFAACYLQLQVEQGRLFALSPASMSILGFERSQPVFSLWNDLSHLFSI